MKERGEVEAQPSTIAQHQFVVYEQGYIVVEELIEKSVEVVATGVSEAEAEALARLVSRLRELGFNVARGATVDMVKMAARYSKTSYETILSECKNAMLSMLYSASALMVYTPTPGAMFRIYMERVDTLIAKVRNATSASELLSVLDDVAGVYEYAKRIPLDYSRYASSMLDLVNQMLQRASGDAKESLERFKQVLELLRDRDRLVELLARFYVLMDMVRDDTYRLVMASYGPYIDALLRVASGRATPLDLELATTGVLILLELEEKGALKIEELPILRETERAVSERLGAGELRRRVMERLAKYRESVSRGIEPSRDPLPYVKVAETLAMINPSRHIYSAVYGLVSSLVPNNPTLAMALASAVTSSVTSAIGTLLPPVGVALISIAIVDSATDVGTRLANPVDRELFVKLLSEHWQDIAVAVAVGVAAGIGTAKLSSYVAQKTYPKLISAIEKKSPVLAEKIRGILGAKLIEGRPIYTERDVTVTVTDDGHIVVYERSAGTVKVLGKYKLPAKIYAVLEDPEAKVKVGAFLSKRGLVLWGTAGDDLVFLDETGGVYILSVSGKEATVISDAMSVKGKIVTFSQLARENPEAFNYLYTATRIAGLSLDDLANNPEYMGLLRIFMQQGKAYGVVNVKGVTFEFAGDKLFIRSGKATLATIDLSRLKEQAVALMDMAEFLKHFEAQLGIVYRNVLLDTAAFGYGLLSPQIVAYDEILRVASTLGLPPPADLYRILPPVNKATGVHYVSGNKQLFVSNQLLGDAKILLETRLTREVVHGLLRSRFAERGVTVIQLPPELQKYIVEAINKGAKGPHVFSTAAQIAASAGNNAGATMLYNLYVLFGFVDYGLTSVEVFGSAPTGMLAGLTAVNVAILQASQRAAEALSRGEVETARQTIMSALIQTGLSEQAARQVANSVIGGARTVTASITIPREIVEEKTHVAVRHEPVERYTSESARGTVAPVLKVDTKVEERTISSPSYEPTSKYTSERARGVVEPVIEVNTEMEERITISPSYEPTSKYTREWARGVVIPVEHVSLGEREMVVPSFEYGKVEVGVVERVTGKVMPVVREEVVPVLVTMTVNVEEEEEYTPPPPTTPQATGGAGIPPLIGGPGARAEGERRRIEERRGVGEREVLVY